MVQGERRFTSSNEIETRNGANGSHEHSSHRSVLYCFEEPPQILKSVVQLGASSGFSTRAEELLNVLVQQPHGGMKFVALVHVLNIERERDGRVRHGPRRGPCRRRNGR